TVKVNGVVPDWPSALSALVAAIDSEASSLRITPLAEAVPRTVPALGFDSVTVKASSDSTRVSPATPIVMTLEVSPAAKLTVPDGSTPPAKSATLTAAPVTAQLALAAPLVSPARRSSELNGVVPDWPSALSALVAAIDSEASSLRIVPLAVVVPSTVPALGFESLTVKASFDSTRVSPATSMLITFEVSPAAKLTIPDGSTPPVKSVPLTAAPVTAQRALAAPLVSPVRVTLKVNGAVPDWPSALSALIAAIDSEASSLRITPLAEAVPRTVPTLGLDSVTVKASSDSTRVSPATPIVMTLEVSP